MSAKELSARQSQAVAALLGSRSIAEAAEACGCSERTLRRWLRDAAFLTALRDAEADLLAHAARRVCSLVLRSLDVLEDGLADRASGAQLRAASVALAAGLPLREAAELERRVVHLEAVVSDEQRS